MANSTVKVYGTTGTGRKVEGTELGALVNAVSSNTAVATVAKKASNDGFTVTTLTPGTTTITVSSGSLTKTLTVTVSASALASLTLQNATISVTEGDTIDLAAAIFP